MKKNALVYILLLLFISSLAGLAFLYFLYQGQLKVDNENNEMSSMGVEFYKSEQIISQLEQENRELGERLAEMRYNPFADQYGCRKDNCLVRTIDGFFGVASITGYYTQAERSAWDETKVCDMFVVATGTDPIVRELRGWVKGGNAVNLIDDQDNLVVNIKFSDVSEQQKQTIMESSPEVPVTLTVLRHSSSLGEVPVCWSNFTILDASA